MGQLADRGSIDGWVIFVRDQPDPTCGYLPIFDSGYPCRQPATYRMLVEGVYPEDASLVAYACISHGLRARDLTCLVEIRSLSTASGRPAAGQETAASR